MSIQPQSRSNETQLNPYSQYNFDLQDESGDMDALGSILLWDEDDDATVAAGVEAAGVALSVQPNCYPQQQAQQVTQQQAQQVAPTTPHTFYMNNGSGVLQQVSLPTNVTACPNYNPLGSYAPQTNQVQKYQVVGETAVPSQQPQVSNPLTAKIPEPSLNQSQNQPTPQGAASTPFYPYPNFGMFPPPANVASSSTQPFSPNPLMSNIPTPNPAQHQHRMQQIPSSSSTSSIKNIPNSDSHPAYLSQVNWMINSTQGQSLGTPIAPQPTASESKKRKVPPTSNLNPIVSCSSDAEESSCSSKPVSAEQKAQSNRERNREHAKNTRLRKKAYVEKLKITVDELCKERDTLVNERAVHARKIAEIHRTRVDVLKGYFGLRSVYEKRRQIWSSVLDEGFCCVLPVTPYRSFPASEVQVSKCQRTILGVDAAIADTGSLHLLLNSLVDRKAFPSESIGFRYTLVTEDAVIENNQLMACWALQTTNAVHLSSGRVGCEISKRGMLCCRFNSQYKIVYMELMFDVMAFMLQLKQITNVSNDGSPSTASGSVFSVIPNTIATCQKQFGVPMCMTLAERPYTILQVNHLWEKMTGYTSDEVVGKHSCSILQSQETEFQSEDHRKELNGIMENVRFKRVGWGMLSNVTKARKKFRNFLQVFPLSSDSQITHYLGLTVFHEHLEDPDGSLTSSEGSNARGVSKVNEEFNFSEC